MTKKASKATPARLEVARKDGKRVRVSVPGDDAPTPAPAPKAKKAPPAPKKPARPNVRAHAAKGGKPPKPERPSALASAVLVLASAPAEGMTAKEMVRAMAAAKLWASPAGKTPEATLYAAIVREIARKGDHARFRKVDRGRFVLAQPAA